MYHSINVNTGLPIADLEHFRQSAADVVTTPLASRVMRRHYGSEAFDLVDSPDNPAGRVRLYAVTAAALFRWEPRLHLTRIQALASNRAGQVVYTIDGTVTIGNQQYALNNFELA